MFKASCRREIATPLPDTSTGDGRLRAVDGVRGLAFLMVFLFHVHLFVIKPGTELWDRVYDKIAGIGWVGVDVFFVLSGFLITRILIHSRDDRGYYRVFYARRTIRIFPLYYVSLILLFGLLPLILQLLDRENVFKDLLRPPAQIFAWFYVLNWRIGLTSYSTVPFVIHHFWSLSIEEQFYLAWPFLVRSLQNSYLSFACVMLGIVSLACRLVCFKFHMPEAAYLLTVCRLDALAIGGLVAIGRNNSRYWNLLRRCAPTLLAALFSALIAIVALTKNVGSGEFWMGTIGITLWGLLFGGSLVIILSSGGDSRIGRLLSFPLFRLLGRYSYCLYICHQPLSLFLGRAHIFDWMLLYFHYRFAAVLMTNSVILALALLISLGSWHLLEKRFLNCKSLPFFSYKVSVRS